MGRRQTPSLPGLPKWRCGCLLAPTWPGHLPGFSHEEKKKRRGAWPEARKVADRAQQLLRRIVDDDRSPETTAVMI
ncbi:hypothetical protein BDA96_02G393700 [Sorghum bicolor]|uniref:Uncharacterized protein n=1 Tax=Sorghum bicolor TaxID=4558 RepID=A0A921RSF5_SORBI|nr:hypothetical protein BDA96_02G393700 [Sorghum bicolor]